MSRWRRYGHDRLYVKDSAGADLGWWDVARGEAHPTRPEHGPLLQQAASAWRLVPPTEAPVVTTKAVLDEERPTWHDLAGSVPGAKAREQATALKEAEPVRTVLRRGSDIDHVVIGPGGVFTVNTKHHPRAKVWVAKNTFLVNGQRQPYVHNSRHEAARAAQLLTSKCGFRLPVSAVIAVVGADNVAVKESPADVQVLWRGQVVRWLRRRPITLNDTAITTIYDVARRSSTWVS